MERAAETRGWKREANVVNKVAIAMQVTADSWDALGYMVSSIALKATETAPASPLLPGNI